MSSLVHEPLHPTYPQEAASPAGFQWQIKMYFLLLSVQLRSQMSYRWSFWMELLSTGLANAILFFSLALIIQRFGNVLGWSLSELALLFGLMETSFGLMDMIFSGFDDSYFADLIRLGRLDQVLLRPLDVFWQVLGSRFLLRRLGRVIEGLLILGFAFTTLNLSWTFLKILYLPVILASQVLAMGALFIVGATITFWTLQSTEAMNILTYGGSELMSYPMTIYPLGLRRFFTYVVPFIFINFYPALYLLDKPDPLNFPSFAPFLAPFAAGLMFAAALKFWQLGVNHYQSSGS